jgi:translation initiation factor 1 (eIF-1/SUI1)
MDNPFEIESTSLENFNDENLLISVERQGRKQNTFISGWEITESDMKTHLKNLKRSLGCNGSIKTHKINGEETTVLHLQGNKSDKVYEYLIGQGIDEKAISIRE